MSPEECPGTRHGDATAYQSYGCRCDDAKAAQATYRKRLRWRHHKGDVIRVPAWRVHRRIRALQALGWPIPELRTRLGYAVTGDWLIDADAVHYRTAVFLKVDALYRELCMTVGPSRWTRTWAVGRGYAPPLAWDDIDDPDERPKTGQRGRGRTDVDPVVVQRAIAGDRLPLTTAERFAVVAALRARGMSLVRIEAHTGITKAERYIDRTEHVA